MSETERQQPGDGDTRAVLLGWLGFHRDAIADKCRGLSDEQLVTASISPSKLTVLGLVRHLTEMERVYAAYALGGGELEFVYGPYEDGGPEGDFDDLTPAHVAPSLAALRAEQAASDAAIARFDSLDAPGAGNGRSLQWNLVKLLQEYARHNGHADLIREALDGTTGE
jgi:hypothetical protein